MEQVVNRKQVLELIEQLRPLWPDKAKELEEALAKLPPGKVDGIRLKGSVHMKLEKFDGEIESGKQPVEVIESEEPLF